VILYHRIDKTHGERITNCSGGEHIIGVWGADSSVLHPLGMRLGYVLGGCDKSLQKD
jgi:hypothetical protein